MKIILNGNAGTTNFRDALTELVAGADSLSVAVSYVQKGGWNLFRQQTAPIASARVRLLCTDQMGITQPAAVSDALNSGSQVRNYSGSKTFHPKVYIAHDRSGSAMRLLIGSANLSYSALTDSQESAILGSDAASLRTAEGWFNNLFQNQGEQFTPARLHELEIKWREAASRRARERFRVRRGIVIPPGVAVAVQAEDLDALEDVFATIQLPIGLLSMDYAGNNIRNVAKVREVLRSRTPLSGKQKSELKLLGLMQAGALTPLGRSAAGAASVEALAELWCRWIQTTPDLELFAINSRLLIAKRVFPQFWRLKAEVRDYFLANAQKPKDRRVLQTIELLCNARDVVKDFSLEDMRTLAPLLSTPASLAPHVRGEVVDYFENKGTRSWDFADRRILPEAWRAAAGGP